MSGTVGTARASDVRRRDEWVRAWPVNKPALVALAKGGALLLAVWTAVGLAYMAVLDDGPVGDTDRDWSRWLEERRTPTWDSLSHYGSMLSDTLVKVALVAVLGAAMIAVWRRWHDGVFLAVAVIVEASIFVVVSFIVDRDRPPVVKLDPPAPSGSFPSGHTAAAVAFYAGLFVIVCWHTRNRVVRTVFGIVAVAAPLVVGTSRAYRGMHHPIDVVAGLLLGIAALVVVRAAMRAGVAEIDRKADDTVPERVRRLDLTTPHPDPDRLVAGGQP